MNGAIDRDEIRQFLQEQFDTAEETGGVSIVSLMHHAHTGPVELLSLKTGHAKWGNPEGMANLFDAFGTRHAKGVMGGGAQQYELAICRGADNKTSSVLPFVRVGSPNMTGPSGSIATEPPTEMGRVQQAQRWGEQITQLAFVGMGHLQHSQQAALDARDRKIAEDAVTNRELWLACKTLLMELDKQRHDTRMSELAAARAAEFQRQVMALAPALINMMSGRDIFPAALAENSLLDGLAAGTTPEQMRAFAGIIATQVQNGDKLSAVVMDHYNKYHERMARIAAEEKRLLKSAPGDYEAGERDAAGEALKALRGSRPEEEEKALSSPKVGLLKAVETTIDNGVANGVVSGNGVAHDVQQGDSGQQDDTALIESLFRELPQLDSALGFLEATKPELAARLKARLAAMKDK